MAASDGQDCVKFHFFYELLIPGYIIIKFACVLAFSAVYCFLSFLLNRYKQFFL